jgi:hypothetical protein
MHILNFAAKIITKLLKSISMSFLVSPELTPLLSPRLQQAKPAPKGRQPKESEKSFTGRISKVKRILMLKFSKLILLSPPFEGGVAAAQ